MGSILVFQSHGRGMSYKPHIHCLLTNGGMNKDGDWNNIGPLPLAQMTKTFQKYFRKYFQKAWSKTNPDDPIAEAGKYSIYDRHHENNADKILSYLSRSIHGVVNGSINEINNEAGSKISINEIKEGTARVTYLELKTYLDRYLNHIPPAGSIMVRYYGLYSNRHREDFKKAQEKFPVEQETKETRQSPSCPKCQHTMDLIANTQPGEYIQYKKYGFMNGPPSHGEFAMGE